MNRARFETSTCGRCVTLTAPGAEPREFWVPQTAGGLAYVREGSFSGPQVCGRLQRTGDTLRASPSTLLAVIRREWRRRQSAGSQA